MNLTHVSKAFEAAGGRFVTRPAELAERLAGLRALAFDWDGVFNAGVKSGEDHSPFSEADAMGLNLLRYGFRRRFDRRLACVIITGLPNRGALAFAERERLDLVYLHVKDKAAAFRHAAHTLGIQPEEIGYMFDDVNDLAAAQLAGVRTLVRRAAGPLLADFVVQNQWADYVTGAEGGAYAVREWSELCLGLLGVFAGTVEGRVSMSADYLAYWQERQATTRRVMEPDGDVFLLKEVS